MPCSHSIPLSLSPLPLPQVDSAISATESQLEAYVSKFVGDQLSQARQQLERYSESYLGTMTSALEVGQMGAEHRLAALDKVKAVLGRMDTLGAEVEALLATVERGVPRSREPCIAFDELEELEELAGTQEVAPAAAAAAAAEGSQQQQAQGAEAKAKGALAPEEHVGREGATAEPQQQQQRVQEAVSSGPGEGQLAAVMGQVQAAAAASAAGNAEGAWTAVGRLWQQPWEQPQQPQQQEQQDGGAPSPSSSPTAMAAAKAEGGSSAHKEQQEGHEAGNAGVLAPQCDGLNVHGGAAGAEDPQDLMAAQQSLGESALKVSVVQGAALGEGGRNVEEAASSRGGELPPAPPSPSSNKGSCCDEWAVVEGDGEQEQQQQ